LIIRYPDGKPAITFWTTPPLAAVRNGKIVMAPTASEQFTTFDGIDTVRIDAFPAGGSLHINSAAPELDTTMHIEARDRVYPFYQD